ncbi:hypothetical protein [Mycobacterium sp. JS623]|uniref:hypothetical protein n=1 Tax=Mycobacterium sp. JS623 TaxID=212767 RepID=UPI0002DD9B36|nr:hypothetical protein [Mycobacterium sp. JS623]
MSSGRLGVLLEGTSEGPQFLLISRLAPVANQPTAKPTTTMAVHDHAEDAAEFDDEYAR